MIEIERHENKFSPYINLDDQNNDDDDGDDDDPIHRNSMIKIINR